jgi:hypothetical protein
MEAERRVRATEEDCRKSLITDVTSMLPNVLRQSEVEERLVVYQREVCKQVCRAFHLTTHNDHTSICASIMLTKINWNLHHTPRRFSKRHPANTVMLLPATAGTFSQILSALRYDSYNILRTTTTKTLSPLTLSPLTCDHFAPFVFSVRSLFGALVERNLYTIHALISRPTITNYMAPVNAMGAVESVMVGFVILTLSNDDHATRKKCGGKRKRKRTTSSVWVDLFEIFQDYQRYGFGRSAANLFPSIIEQDFKAKPSPKDICLNPLESAQPFWRACGFNWTKPNEEGHMHKRILKPNNLPRKRSRHS